MGQHTEISWCDSTWNPWEGCTRVSPGCRHCYAEARNHRFGMDNWGPGKPRRRTSTGNWKQPLRWNQSNFQFVELRDGGTFRGTFESVAAELGVQKSDLLYPNSEIFKNVFPCRQRVFCASLADWLDDEVPIEWLADLLKLIHDTPNLDWLMLTKRTEDWSERMYSAGENLGPRFNRSDRGALTSWIADWLDGKGPANVWIGTSVEDQKRADERIPELLKIPARVRFLSCEPLLESIRIRDALRCDIPIHWVIAGLESGPKKRRGAGLEGLRALRDQCVGTEAKFFCKQIDKVQPIPPDLMIREFPSVL